jgi:diguanylate cyclase (GGDEF)-like protein
MPAIALALCGVAETSLLLSLALLTAWRRFGRKPHALLWTVAFFLFTLDHLLMTARAYNDHESFGLTLLSTWATLTGATLVALGFRARAGLERWKPVVLFSAVTILVCTGLIIWRWASPVHHPVASGFSAAMLLLSVDAMRCSGRDGRSAGMIPMTMMVIFTLFFLFLTVLGLLTAPFGPVQDAVYLAAYLVGVPTSLTGIGLFALVLLAADLAQELRQLALVDPLTGLLNRRGIETHALREVARCLREGRPLTVVLADLDHFKAVNDALGHAVGDGVLQCFAAHLSASARAGDLVGRFGGEEFILVLPGADVQRAQEVVARIRKTAPQSLDAPGLQRMPTASFGLSALGDAADSLQAAISRADTALYRAKSDGRDCVRVAEAAWMRDQGGGS